MHGLLVKGDCASLPVFTKNRIESKLPNEDEALFLGF